MLLQNARIGISNDTEVDGAVAITRYGIWAVKLFPHWDNHRWVVWGEEETSVITYIITDEGREVYNRTDVYTEGLDEEYSWTCDSLAIVHRYPSNGCHCELCRENDYLLGQ